MQRHGRKRQGHLVTGPLQVRLGRPRVFECLDHILNLFQILGMHHDLYLGPCPSYSCARPGHPSTRAHAQTAAAVRMTQERTCSTCTASLPWIWNNPAAERAIQRRTSCWHRDVGNALTCLLRCHHGGWQIIRDAQDTARWVILFVQGRRAGAREEAGLMASVCPPPCRRWISGLAHRLQALLFLVKLLLCFPSCQVCVLV